MPMELDDSTSPSRVVCVVDGTTPPSGSLKCIVSDAGVGVLVGKGDGNKGNENGSATMPANGSGDGEAAASTRTLPAKSSIGRQRQMKKDDSGISVEKSHDESSEEEENEAETAAIVKRGKGKGLSKLDVKKTEGVSDKSSPDSGHHEGRFDPDELSLPDKSEGASSDSEKQFEKELLHHRHLLKRRKRKTTEGSSSDEMCKRSEDSNEMEDDDDDLEEEDAKDANKTDSKKDDENSKKYPKPPYHWFICSELFKRQCGYSNQYHSDLFRLRASGSLHMVERLELMYKMKHHDGCVNSLHFNCSGTRLASGSDDLNIVIWDWTISEPVLIYDSGHRSNVFQAKFIPYSGDCHIVTCARDGQVRLGELSSTGVCKNTRRLAQHRGPAHKLALQYDTPHSFLSVGEDALVYEIDLRESKPEKLLTCRDDQHKIALYTVYSNPGKPVEFAIGGRDQRIWIYDKRKIPENGCLKTFCPDHLVNSETKPNVTCLVYNYNGSEILATYNDEHIYTFDSQHSDGADYTHVYKGHRNNATVKGVNYFGSRSQFIVSGSDCGHIYLWDHDTQHVVNFMAGDEGGVVNCLEQHPQMPILATSGLDDDVKIWVPSSESPPALSELRKTMTANQKDREDDRSREPDAVDGQMLWLFMHHLRRTARRQRREGREVEETSSDNTGDSDDSDDSDENPHAVQCAPS